VEQQLQNKCWMQPSSQQGAEARRKAWWLLCPSPALNFTPIDIIGIPKILDCLQFVAAALSAESDSPVDMVDSVDRRRSFWSILRADGADLVTFV
jgi:hypothetical protein